MIQRTLHIESFLRPDKVLILYGPRQVGKTTLLKRYMSEHHPDVQYRTGDDLVFANDIGRCDLHLLRSMVEPDSLFAIDEAQKIPEIGRALKLIVDNIPGVQVIVTGSSSFDLAHRTGEALTGRKTVCMLYPVSLQELLYTSTPYDLNRRLPELLVYGMYPEVVSLTSAAEKSERLREIAHSYLLKDILEFDSVKSSRVLMDLLRLVAFQIGSELSTTELSRSLGIDKNTVSRARGPFG
ncbi:MAG: ATP-binding protein [Spirochaetia bacterium]|nr:ATP-binding protein [Spirochaetia bacterium]